MANLLEGKALRQLLLGKKVERATAAHAAATTPYFTINTGRVLLTGLVGTCVTESGANNCSWVAEPTAGADVPICGNLDINPLVAGELMTITGVGSAAMTYNASATGLPMLANPVVLPVGDLSFIAAAAEGSSSWTLFYIPIDDGAYVTAA
jgi:hypothetical protein